ncbi:hypothetical protein AAFN86_08890 [Roseomonas sp. CAU 1739]|uniref:hypothetical protein n=1 Tax=Roseomonas sp. CAU 1739 TaxID=3140364 RepID=UPI00325A82A4
MAWTTSPAARIVGTHLALMVVFVVGYTIAGAFSEVGAEGAAVWAVILMVIYCPPVFLISALLALIFRSRLVRVFVATVATAATVGALHLFAGGGAAAAVATVIGMGTMLLLAMYPARAPR